MKLKGNGKWGLEVLHAFDYSDGNLPYDGVTMDSKGNLYGVTESGGPSGYGVAYELSPMKSALK